MESSLLALALFSVFCWTSAAFNITNILSNYPDFSTFNSLLTQTELALQINSRQTITVLAVYNAAIGGLSAKPIHIINRILSSHVILDYYDQGKLQSIKKNTTLLTTLYQNTGAADNQQGFLNVTKTPTGIVFGSAVKDAPLTASLRGSLASQPYNISVLQLSAVIEAPGIEATSPPHPPNKAPAPTPSAQDAPLISPPQPNPTPADATPADAPTIAKSASSSLHNVGGVIAAGGLHHGLLQPWQFFLEKKINQY